MSVLTGSSIVWEKSTSTPDLISWGPSTEYDTGGPNAVDMDNNGNCVEVHVGTYRLFYRVGKIDFNSQTISWGPSTQYDTSADQCSCYG